MCGEIANKGIGHLSGVLAALDGPSVGAMLAFLILEKTDDIPWIHSPHWLSPHGHEPLTQYDT
jgi:hypothetical protein